MNKHRIIGLIVLIAIAVIAGQYCLNYYKGSRHHLQAYRSPPLAPLDDNLTSPSNAPKVQEVETLVEQHFDIMPEKVPSVPAWIVQVAILSNETSAKTLTKQLKNLGFDAFISPLSLQNKAVYRVAAGPFTQQQLAVSALTTIQENLKITGILKQYTIGDNKEETTP
jgi:cell division septation protein DedD